MSEYFRLVQRNVETLDSGESSRVSITTAEAMNPSGRDGAGARMKRFLGKSSRQRIITLVHGVRPDFPRTSLTGEIRLRDDLGLDSLSLVALSVRLHEDLGVDLMALAERAADIQTIDDLVAAVDGITRAQR